MSLNYKEARQFLTPQEALQLLQKGNQRFIRNLSINRNFLQIINETADQQFPFAAILSCSDSRISNELVFDLGLGDVFSIRLAGNIASINAIGSMEYACKVLGSKVIVVMGHTNCGAVKAACEGVQLDNLTSLLDHIRDAIDASAMPEERRQCGNKEFINELALRNVHYNIEAIMQTSTIIHDMVHSGEVGIIGAMYDVNTGNVVFYDAKQNLKIENEAFAIYEG